MRITIVNQYYPPDMGPTGKLAASLARHRADLGDKVTIVSSTGRYAGGPPTDEPAGCDDRVTVLRTWGPRWVATSIARRAFQYLAFYVGAWRLLRRLPRQDVIVCLTTPPLIAVVAVAHRRRHRRNGGCRLILWNMDCYPEILEVAGLISRGGLLARACRRVNRWLYARLDHIVCLDDAMRDRLQLPDDAGRPAPSFSVIPNWEPLDRFPDRAPAEPWAGRDRLDIGERFVVLYQGNAGYGHQFDNVIEAAEILRDDGVVFLFIGGGVHHQRLEKAAAARGLDNLLCHPYVPESELHSVLASADVGLITLADDAAGVMSPSKLHAYLAASLPVIYSGPAGGNVATAIEQFACGVRVTGQDGATMAQCVRNLMTERRWHDAMKRRARYAFEEAYCDAKTLPQFDAVFDAMVNPPCVESEATATSASQEASGADERAAA